MKAADQKRLAKDAIDRLVEQAEIKNSQPVQWWVGGKSGNGA
ncbi:hypothetical protein [Chelatococcus asaccharovorans]|nr:hypothetical protein [Chelatococcus asaccharovorans]